MFLETGGQSITNRANSEPQTRLSHEESRAPHHRQGGRDVRDQDRHTHRRKNRDTLLRVGPRAHQELNRKQALKELYDANQCIQIKNIPQAGKVPQNEEAAGHSRRHATRQDAYDDHEL